MPTQKPNDIFDNNAFEFEFSVQQKNDETGKWEPATLIPDLRVWISAADEGDALNPALVVSAVERSQKAGTYYARMDGLAVHAWVFPVTDGTQFYVVGGTSSNSDIKISSPRRAWAVRRV